jgi:hypothetical protein
MRVSRHIFEHAFGFAEQRFKLFIAADKSAGDVSLLQWQKFAFVIFRFERFVRYDLRFFEY